MLKKFLFKAVAAIASSAVVTFSAAMASAYADWYSYGCLGDLNNDKQFTIADIVILTKHLLRDEALTSENGYDLRGQYVGINGSDGFLSGKILVTADMNQDDTVDVFDLVQMRKDIVDGNEKIIWQWIEDATEPPTTEPEIPQTDFISPTVLDLYGSMPSQGEAEVVVFYVDFPDCRYDYLPSISEIEEAAFGDKNESSKNYPFESLNAFFDRSSKGALKIDGKAYTYTTKKNKSAYENDVWHTEIVNELIEEFDAQVDFSQFDGNNDKTIDTILISVPNDAGDDNWWPGAGIFGGETINRADGMNIGHVIVGNSQIKSGNDYSGFCSSYVHEMGHCMGLPDYYLYTNDDFQGMHGSAGFELMDDAICDLGAASKLMLGWYTEDQIKVYDKNAGTQSFTLNCGQKNNGNCVIIPVGELAEKYCSEFFILEYADMSGNNSDLSKEWWRSTGSGVRMYHVEATLTGDYWYNGFKYQSGNDEYTNYNNGRRFIRLVGEGTDNTDNMLRTGDVINGSTLDFRSYDSSGGLTVNMGITVNIGANVGDAYEITISAE